MSKNVLSQFISALAVLFFIFLAIGSSDEKEPLDENELNKAETDVLKDAFINSIDKISFPAQKLMEGAERNPTKFNADYGGGRYMQINGYLESTGRDANGSFIKLKGSSTSGRNIKCYIGSPDISDLLPELAEKLPPGKKQTLESLKVEIGDHVLVYGNCVGLREELILQNSWVMKL